MTIEELALDFLIKGTIARAACRANHPVGSPGRERALDAVATERDAYVLLCEAVEKEAKR